MCDTYTKRENTLNSSVSKQFIKVTSLEWQWLKKGKVYFFKCFSHTQIDAYVIDLSLNHSFLRVGIEPTTVAFTQTLYH